MSSQIGIHQEWSAIEREETMASMTVMRVELKAEKKVEQMAEAREEDCLRNTHNSHLTRNTQSDRNRSIRTFSRENP